LCSSAFGEKIPDKDRKWQVTFHLPVWSFFEGMPDGFWASDFEWREVFKRQAGRLFHLLRISVLQVRRKLAKLSGEKNSRPGLERLF